MPNADGSSRCYFGYMNTNWLEEFDVPIGPDNAIEPGGPDQGQPTHFYPRRSPFPVHGATCPGDSARQGIDLDAHDARQDRESAYASLKTDYQIDKQVISTEVGGDFGSLRDELRTEPARRSCGSKVRRGGARRSAKRSRWSRLPAIPTTCPARRTESRSLATPAGGRWMNRLPPSPRATPSPTACEPREHHLPAAFVDRALERPRTALVLDRLPRQCRRP